MTRHIIAAATTCVSLLTVVSCAAPAPPPKQQTFASPEDAVGVLIAAAKASSMDQLLEIFGPEGKELANSSDPATGRRNLQIFTAAVAEGWQLIDHGPDKKALVIGNEKWPFPIPLAKDASGWRFDTAAGKEEVLARRIGRNELAAIRTCRTYVVAQQLYARRGHDGKPPGLYAKTFHSDPGKENGLYWPAARGERRSPLGDLMAQAEAESRTQPAGGEGPSPFHGYYFKILTAQGPDAPGGEQDYVRNGELSGGFALVAWPAQYDVTGIMTFIVNRDGLLHESDLGPGTDALVRALMRYDPGPSWTPVR